MASWLDGPTLVLTEVPLPRHPVCSATALYEDPFKCKRFSLLQEKNSLAWQLNETHLPPMVKVLPSKHWEAFYQWHCSDVSLFNSVVKWKGELVGFQMPQGTLRLDLQVDYELDYLVLQISANLIQNYSKEIISHNKTVRKCQGWRTQQCHQRPGDFSNFRLWHPQRRAH